MRHSDVVVDHSAGVEHYPGESRVSVKPVDGAMVCCGIYGVFKHTGIWVDGHIIELHGSGLVKAVSPQRFLNDRSGENIYMLCDKDLHPLVAAGAAERAVSRIFTYIEYHPWGNNCHRFTFDVATGQKSAVCSFYDFNVAVNRYFHRRLYWQPVSIPRTY